MMKNFRAFLEFSFLPLKPTDSKSGEDVNVLQVMEPKSLKSLP